MRRLRIKNKAEIITYCRDRRPRLSVYNDYRKPRLYKTRKRRNQASLREGGGTRSKLQSSVCSDGRSLRDLEVQLSFIVTRSPSPDFVGSSLPEGAFGLCVPKVRLLFLTSTAFADTKAIFYFNFSFIFAISSLNPSRKPYQLSFTL